MTYNTFKEAFLGVNNAIMSTPDFVLESRTGNMNEHLGIHYVVRDPTTYDFSCDHINRIPTDYAEEFFNFMISGNANVEGEFEKWPHTAQFYTRKKDSILPDNFNSLYGPRIFKQIGPALHELSKEGSRRAVLMILEADDQLLYEADETIEYPCTISITLLVREGRLYVHTFMRSENTAVVMQLDMYLMGKLTCHIANVLEIEVGAFSSTISSAHIFERDFDYVNHFMMQELNYVTV